VQTYLTDSHQLGFQANVDPELGFYEFFAPMMRRAFSLSNSDMHQFVQGGNGELNPDFRIERRLPNSRNFRASCLVEVKRHSVNLDTLQNNRDLQDQQILRYLNLSEYVLITNFWEFRLLRRNSNAQNWPPQEIARYNITDSENDFRALVANPDHRVDERMEGLVNFLNNYVVTIPAGGTNSLTDLRSAFFDLNNATISALRTHRNQPTAQGVAANNIITRITTYVGNMQDEDLYRFAGQINCLSMMLLRSCSGENPQTLDLQRQDHIRNPTLRYQYSEFVSNRVLLGLENVTDHLVNCLVSNAVNFLDFSTMEREFEQFLEITNPGWKGRYGYELTPPELVDYMISLSDIRLRQIDGFGGTGILRDAGTEANRAHIIDPCCGTGRFYLSILRYIFDNMEGGNAVKQLAVARAIGNRERHSRVHAFDIQPTCVLMTQLGLERFLEEINMPEDITATLTPSIHMTDSLSGWGGIVDFDGNMFVESSLIKRIKNGQINLLIGNPPWRGHESELDPQNAQRMTQLCSDWQTRSAQEITDRGSRPKMPPFDPYVAFFRIAYLKTLNDSYAIIPSSGPRGKSRKKKMHDSTKMVTCFVTPQNYTFGNPKFAMREDFVNNLDLTVDLLGGDYRKNHGGNCFPVSLGNSICSFRKNAPQLIRRVHFEPLYSNDNAEDRRLKIAQLVDDINHPNLLSLFEVYEPNQENWYRFYGGMVGVPPWPTIEDIRNVQTNGLHEKRGWVMATPSSENLETNVNGFFTNNFDTACISNPNLWRGKVNSGANFIPTHGRRPWGDFNAEDRWNALQEYTDNHDWFSQATITPFNHLHVFLPPPEATVGNLWNRPRRAAQRWGDVGGMICIAKQEVNLDTELRVCFVPELPLSAHTINQNANSHPLFYRGVLDEVTEELPNLSEEFLNWIQTEGEYTDVPPIELSENIWYHVLSILSSPEYNDSDWLELPAGILLPVPIPDTLDRLNQSAALGRQIASLQRLDSGNVNHNQDIEDAIDEWFNQIELEPYSISNARSSAMIIRAGVSLDRRHGTRGKISFRRYRELGEPTEINENLLGNISDLLDITTDVISDILGPLQSIQLSVDIGLRNVPRNILTMNIGGHCVLGQWLAWRCESSVSNQPIENLWNDLRRLIINMVHMRLLYPRLDENFDDCLNNNLEWDD
jgi:hypothetical protein